MQNSLCPPTHTFHLVALRQSIIPPIYYSTGVKNVKYFIKTGSKAAFSHSLCPVYLQLMVTDKNNLLSVSHLLFNSKS